MQALILLAIFSFDVYNVNDRKFDIYGFVQMYYRYSGRDDNTISLRRSRLIFKIKEGRGLTFKMQMDFLKSPALLDAYIKYDVNAFVFKLGRFLPDFTFYMPHSSTSLDFVDYPFICKTYGMWRQVGAEISYFITPGMYTKVGIFNGPKNSYRDTDGMKDVLVKIGYNKEWLGIGIYAYQERMIGQTRRLYGLYSDFRPKRYIFTVEPLFVSSDSTDNHKKDLGYYVQTGMYVASGVKSLLRFEEQYMNIDTTLSPIRRVWFGMVKEFGHFKLYVNYIKGLKGDNTKDLFVQLQYKW